MERDERACARDHTPSTNQRQRLSGLNGLHICAGRDHAQTVYHIDNKTNASHERQELLTSVVASSDSHVLPLCVTIHVPPLVTAVRALAPFGTLVFRKKERSS